MATFRESFCGCVNDIFSCYIATCCPGGLCFLSAKAASEASKDPFWPHCLLSSCLCCIGNAVNRATIRQKYQFIGSYGGDLCVHCFCPVCAVTQEYREVMKKEYIELKPIRST